MPSHTSCIEEIVLPKKKNYIEEVKLWKEYYELINKRRELKDRRDIREINTKIVLVLKKLVKITSSKKEKEDLNKL